MALARSLTRTGAIPQAREVLDTTIKVAGTIKDNEKRSRALIVAADALVQIDEISQAREILAKAGDLATSIENSGTDIRVLGLLAQSMVQTGKFSQTHAEILKILGPNKIDISSYVIKLMWFADLEVKMSEISQARKLLALAFEATKQIKSEIIKASLLVEQARRHFQFNDTEQAQQIVLSALEAFKCSGYSTTNRGVGWQIPKKIGEVLAENIDRFSQEFLISVLLDAFQFARSRGREETMGYIASFAVVLSKLGVVTEAWESIGEVEALFV